MNVFVCNQQLKSHCQKCGRRSRRHNTYINNCRVKSKQRLFPNELPSYPIITQINNNHSILKNILSRNSSRKSSKKNIFIDQLIQVQQCNTRSYNYDIDNNYKKDEYQIFTDIINKQNSNIPQRVQQMIYLRENINNLNYREIHFPNEYIILKRFEEKNNLINNQNRFKVDHYFRPLKLQYQTISMLLQNIPITSFTYSKQDPNQIDVDITKFPQVITTKTNPIQNNWNHIRPIFSNKNISNEYLTQTIWSKNNQQTSSSIYIPDQTIYFDQYPRFMDIHQPQTMFFPWSQNSNYTHQQQLSTVSSIYNPIYNESFSNTWFHPNELQFLTTNHLSPINSSLPNTTDISTPIHQTSKSQNTISNSSQKSLSSINNDTISNISTNRKNNQSIKYTQIIDKIKQILNTLEKNLLYKLISKNKIINISFPSTKISSFNINQTSNKINKSISITMTSDSLISNKNISQLSYSKSTINIENQLDSLNNNYYSNRKISKIKLLNSAKNINHNQQTSEDDKTKKILNYTRSRSRMSISRCVTVQHMSPLFMFVLQILLVTCLINRIFMYYFYGIVPTDTFASIIVDNSQSNIH